MAHYNPIQIIPTDLPTKLFDEALKTLNRDFHQAFQCQSESGKIYILVLGEVSEIKTTMVGALLEALRLTSLQHGWNLTNRLVFKKRPEGFVAAEVTISPSTSTVGFTLIPSTYPDLSVKVKSLIANRVKTSHLMRKLNLYLRMMGWIELPSAIHFRIETSTNTYGPLELQRTLCKIGKMAYRTGLNQQTNGYGPHTMSIESVAVNDSFVATMGGEQNLSYLDLFRRRESRGISSYIDSQSVITFKRSKLHP